MIVERFETLPDEIVDLGDRRIFDLDRKIDTADEDGIRLRWLFGREMLTRRRGKKQLPNGEVERVARLIGKSTREVQYRMRFAQRCADEDQLRNAVSNHKSWHQIVDVLLCSESRVRSLMASTGFEVYTPIRYIEAARKVLGEIYLDPASCRTANRTVQAKRYYSIEQDGLSREWSGQVFLNPPYSQTTGRFVTKLVESFDAGRVGAAIVLLPAYGTDAAWFQPLWNHLACFTNHRLPFYGAGPPFGSVFFYLGPERDRFIEVFNEFGNVVVRAEARKS